MLQAEIADKLLNEKVMNIEKIKPDIISTGNIGCITQIANGTNIPILHTIELLDWYTGGPKPKILQTN
jgi:glycolate oxidase iron-sulfur subunit